MRAAAAVLVLLLAVTPAEATAPSFQDLEESLTCQCGCGLTVHSCNHLQCPSAIPLRQEIRAQMSLGKDKEAILAYFAGKYGEKILSSPTTRGFNLTAWVMPFFIVAVGCLVVVLTLLRWRRAPPPGLASATKPGGPRPVRSEEAKELEKVLERELKQFES